MNRNRSGSLAALGDVYPDLRREARKLARATGTRHLEDDLVQYGALGLIEATRRFDPGRGVPFGAFARHRARGAMLDGLRLELPLSRRAFKGQRVRGRHQVESLDELSAELTDERIDAEAALIEAIELARVRQALQQLSDEQQVIIMAIYDFEGGGVSAAELGRRSGMNRSKVSREHRLILSHLGQVLGGHHG